MNENKVEILASLGDDTEKILDLLKNKGIDVTKCCICGTSILKTERPPHYLWERWQAWRYKQKFYDWNIDAYIPEGVVCDKVGCFADALYRRRNLSSQPKTNEGKQR